MTRFSAKRLGQIISPELSPSIGCNIQGPSLIKAPQWLQQPLGKYYLYFADHKGDHIRLAYANDLVGPWSIYEPGSLQLTESRFLIEQPEENPERLALAQKRVANTPYPHDIRHDLEIPHIASPDVHIDEVNQQIVMYYHGLESYGIQLSRVATSHDGINFSALPDCISRPYLRVFKHQGDFYGLTMPGQFVRSKNGLTDFKTGPTLFSPTMRHNAVLKQGSTLNVFYTNVGDEPERILHTTIDIDADWLQWQTNQTVEVLRPEQDWEGASSPLEPSMRSVAYGSVNQLRDPAIYIENDQAYLLYATAGESGIAIAELNQL